MKNIKNPLLSMVVNGALAAMAGLLIGYVLGMLIYWLSMLSTPSFFQDGPQQIAPFLGMGFGSVIGGLFGGALGLRK